MWQRVHHFILKHKAKFVINRVELGKKQNNVCREEKICYIRALLIRILIEEKVIIGLAAALLVACLDQFSKAVVYGYLAETAPAVKVTSFFNLVTAWNTGVSFSMFNDMGKVGVYVLSAFSLVVAVGLIFWLKKETSRYMQLALGFVIGGALGNVIDRIRFGAVFDFLDVHVSGYHWPAFNLADSFICIGAALIILDGVFGCSCKKEVLSDKGLRK